MKTYKLRPKYLGCMFLPPTIASTIINDLKCDFTYSAVVFIITLKEWFDLPPVDNARLPVEKGATTLHRTQKK